MLVFAFGMERLLLALDNEEDEDEDGLDCYIMPLGEEAKDSCYANYCDVKSKWLYM